MSTVGIIANPASGKDIRRLVAHARFISDQEKANVLKRVLVGLEATGVEQVLIMPESAGLGRAVTNGLPSRANVRILDMEVVNDERDSARAAELMAQMGAGCLITVGGDGTNRAVAKGSGSVPIVPISTGTNNVFATSVEGTVAGLAAGVVAKGIVDLHSVTTVSRLLEVHIDKAQHDIALVDVAVSKDRFVGSRALWDMKMLDEVFLARIEPAAVGLSALGARVYPHPIDDNAGLRIRIGDGGTVVDAPVAPGMVSSVPVLKWERLPVGVPVEIELRPCTIALDGERTFSLPRTHSAYVVLSDKGPPVVSVEEALRQASLSGAFTEGGAAR